LHEGELEFPKGLTPLRASLFDIERGKNIKKRGFAPLRRPFYHPFFKREEEVITLSYPFELPLLRD